MTVSATFNISDLSPSVEDNFEHPSDLRTNPHEEEEVDSEYLSSPSRSISFRLPLFKERIAKKSLLWSPRA